LAFSNCYSLTGITVDERNPAYASVDGVLFNKAKTTLIQYPGGKQGESYTIPAGVTTIESYAFLNNHFITSITIPASVTEVEFGAFASLKLSPATRADIEKRFGRRVFEADDF
jgi:hypothetical protein